MAGSSSTITEHNPPYHPGHPLGEVVIDIVGDDSDGTVPNVTFELPVDAELISLETNPGSTGPTDNWDIALTDTDGFDVLQGLGANRHVSTTLRAVIYVATQLGHPIVKRGELLTLAITNTSVNDATARIRLLYRRIS